MQLGFQTIPKCNASNRYIYRCYKVKIVGCAPGLALRLLLSARVNWALGRLLTILLLQGLPQWLLWLRNHLVHHPLCRSCYTYAYNMRNAIMICNFETSLNRIHTPLPETTRRLKFCKTRNIRILYPEYPDFQEYPG